MSNKLFDFDDDHLEDGDLPEEENPQNDQAFKRDKIFNNDYNTGNLDFEEFSLPRVDTNYAEKNLEDCYNSHDYERDKKLQEMVDIFFQESELYETLKNKKKIPKQNIPLVFVAIRKRFPLNEFLGSEIFSAIAEYFGMNYEILYENIPSLYRQELVRELDERYGILQKRGVKKLF